EERRSIDSLEHRLRPRRREGRAACANARIPSPQFAWCRNRPYPRRMSLRRLVSAAAAAALLYAGLTNAHAHVHLCLDGSEPPATLHWTTGDALTPAHDDHSFPHHHHHGAQGAADTHAS